MQSAIKELMAKCRRLVYHPGRFYPVLFGPLRGLMLRFDTQVNGGEMLGLWERNNFRALSSLRRTGLLDCNDPVAYDIGANFGLYSLFFTRLLASGGRVFAFEPGDFARSLLMDNLRRNNIHSVVVESLACSNQSGTAEFYSTAQQHHTSSLRPERGGEGRDTVEIRRVETTTVDGHWKKVCAPGSRLVIVKMDIEGAGDLALPHCEYVARDQRPFFLIESHSPNEDAAISTLMKRCQYTAYRTTNNRWVLNENSVHPDPNGVWGTMLLVPGEHRSKLEPALGK